MVGCRISVNTLACKLRKNLVRQANCGERDGVALASQPRFALIGAGGFASGRV